MARTVAERRDALPGLLAAFRAHGYAGASLAVLEAHTGLAKGSLYHFFPGGKREMAAAVLAEVHGWFEAEVFAPLRDLPPAEGIARMLAACDACFLGGRRNCLAGVLALGEGNDAFAAPLRAYFARWVAMLAAALERAGHAPPAAAALAEEAVAAVQGGLVLARALAEPAAFGRVLDRLRGRLLAAA